MSGATNRYNPLSTMRLIVCPVHPGDDLDEQGLGFNQSLRQGSPFIRGTLVFFWPVGIYDLPIPCRHTPVEKNYHPAQSICDSSNASALYNFLNRIFSVSGLTGTNNVSHCR